MCLRLTIPALAGLLFVLAGPANGVAAPSPPDGPDPRPWSCAFRSAAIGTENSRVLRPSRRYARVTVRSIVTSLDLEGTVSTPPFVVSRRAAIAARDRGC